MAVNIESCDSLPPDEEPKLKYERLGNDVQNILLTDAVSSICVHTKFICLGTQWGVIHLLDHEGNTVPLSQDERNKELQAHAVAVNCISVDASGEFIASCSDDGRVVVYGLYSSDNTHNLTVGREVKAVALDPNYYRSGSGRRFITGDNRLTLHEKTFLRGLRSTVLCESSGAVSAVAWQERFVAWASDVGVRVYDLDARVSLGLIQWEQDPPPRDFRCNLVWAADNTLMIGWVDTVRICVVRRRRAAELHGRDLTEFLVDPAHTFQLDYHISGLGPLGRQLVLLGVPKDRDPETGASQRPVLVVAEYRDAELSELSTDHLSIREYAQLSPNDYRLDMIAAESLYFVVAPRDVVVASPYSLDDRVGWLQQHRRYERALQVLEEVGGSSRRHSLVSVGERYLDHLLGEQLFEQAAVLCARICKTDRALWERQVLKFAEVNRLRAVSAYLPKTPEHALGSHVYELVLDEFLKEDPRGFLALVKDWEPTLYRTGIVIKELLEHLLTTQGERDKNVYLEALALLYCSQKKYDKALTTYLKLQNKDVFTLIHRHKMYGVIHNKILELMKLDCERALGILLDRSLWNGTLPAVEEVERQLQHHDRLLYRYLDAHSKLEPGGKHHGRLVRLYAEYDRDKLLPFLRSSDTYPIQAALDECVSRGYHPETVFLLARMGSTRDALLVILQRLGDVQQAIAFCQEHNDRELWAELVAHTAQHPQHVAALLQRIGSYVDPRLLVERVPRGCRVPELQDSLAKMMCDYRLQLSVQEACKAITLRDYFELHQRLIGTQRRAISVTDDFLCGVCQGRIIIRDLANASDLVVYNCRHSFHTACLPDTDKPSTDRCTVCTALNIK